MTRDYGMAAVARYSKVGGYGFAFQNQLLAWQVSEWLRTPPRNIYLGGRSRELRDCDVLKRQVFDHGLPATSTVMLTS